MKHKQKMNFKELFFKYYYKQLCIRMLAVDVIGTSLLSI